MSSVSLFSSADKRLFYIKDNERLKAIIGVWMIGYGVRLREDKKVVIVIKDHS